MNRFALVKYCLVMLLVYATHGTIATAAPVSGIGADIAEIVDSAKSLLRADPELAVAMLDSLLQTKELSQRELTEIHYHKGRLYYLGFLEKDQAILSFYQALRHSKNTDDFKRQNSILSFLGLSYKDLNHYEYAQEYYQEALALEGVDEKSRLMTLYNLGKTLRLNNQYDSAIAIQHRLIPSFEAIDMYSYANECRLELGANFIRQKSWERAELAYSGLRQVAQESQDSVLLAQVLVNGLGAVYLGRGELGTARAYFEEALPLMQAGVDEQTLLFNYNNLGILAEKEGNLEEARDYCKQSAELDPRLVDLSVLVANLEGVIEISEKLGDMETAYSYSQKLNEIIIPIVDAQKSLEELHARYLAEKIRKEIEAFELKESLTIAQLRIWLIASVLSLLLVIGGLIYWILKKRQRLDDSVIEHLKQRDQLLYYISYRYHVDVPSMMREMHGEEKLAG